MQGIERTSGKDTLSDSLQRDITIWLDSYDDIFSDFDSRPYSDRLLSDDFIGELKKVCGENEFPVNDLKLLIPEKVRDKASEEVITRRLHSLLRKKFLYHSDKRKEIILKGILKFLVGTVLISIAFYIKRLHSTSISLDLFFVMSEPPGWFLTWTGLEELYQGGKKQGAELEFYKKMHNSNISFVSI